MKVLRNQLHYFTIIAAYFVAQLFILKSFEVINQVI